MSQAVSRWVASNSISVFVLAMSTPWVHRWWAEPTGSVRSTLSLVSSTPLRTLRASRGPIRTPGCSPFLPRGRRTPTPENVDGGDHDLGPGDFRVRGLSEMIDRAFMVGGLEVTGGKVLLASDLAASYTRPEILVNMASLEMVSVPSHTPTPATVDPDDDETEGRARDGDIHIVASEATGSVFATAERSIWLDPKGGLMLQPDGDWAGQVIPPSGGTGRTAPFILAHNTPGPFTVLDPDTVFLAAGNRALGGSADSTLSAFAPSATSAPFGPPTGTLASRVLTSALPDYHLVNWHLSGDGGTGVFDSGYGCPPGMDLVAVQGPGRHIVPIGWRKDRAPTAIERSSLPDLPVPSNSHAALFNGVHPTQTISVSMPITGTPFTVVGSFPVSFPTHPTPSAHPSRPFRSSIRRCRSTR